MVLVVVVGMVVGVEWAVMMILVSVVAYHMEMLICPVNLAVVVEMIAWKYQLLVAVL